MNKLLKSITHNRFILLSLMLCTFIAYFNILPNQFISDDIESIVQNPLLTNFSYMFVNGHLVGIILSIIAILFGKTPLMFHVDSIVWHTLVSIEVFFFIKLLTKNRTWAIVTAFLFALHPIHTEAVAWISGLPYLLYAFFTVLTLYLIIKIDREELSKKWLILASITTFLSYFSSEKAIMLPLLLVVYLFLFSRRVNRSHPEPSESEGEGSGRDSSGPYTLRMTIKNAIFLLWPLGIATVLYGLTLYLRIGQRLAAVNPAPGKSVAILNPLIQIPTAITTYLKLLFVPVNLTLYHEFIMSQQEAWTNGIIFILFILFCVFLFRKNKTLFFFALFFLISLSPMLLPIKISWVVAERYVYFASIGILALFGYVFVWIKKKNEKIFRISFVALLCIYTILTIQRNSQWATPETFWLATADAAPNSAMAHINRGQQYFQSGNIEEAAKEFQLAITLNPDNEDAQFNMGNIYFSTGNPQKAIPYFKKSYELNPTKVDAPIALSLIYLQLNQKEKAQEYIEKAKLIPLKVAGDYRAWAVYYETIGQKDKAKEMLQKAASFTN